MIKNGIDKRTAHDIWDLFPPFARYGFNRSHAAGYATIAYQTAYLKANWPLEFMNALLNAESSDIERIAFLTEEARDFNITVLAPEINESGVGFSITSDTTIRFGLGAIKNVGTSIAEAINRERENGGVFKSIESFLSRLDTKDLNKKSLESLIKTGAFDALEERGKLLANLDNLLAFSKESRQAKEAGQESIFGAMEEKNTPAIKLKEAENIDKKQMLSWEKELLGLYISDHPLNMIKAKLEKKAKPIRDLAPTNNQVAVGGILTKIKKIITKKGQPMIFAELEDLSGKIEVVVFPSALENNAGLWREDNILLIKGKIQDRDNSLKLICNSVAPLDT